MAYYLSLSHIGDVCRNTSTSLNMTAEPPPAVGIIGPYMIKTNNHGIKKH